MLIWEAAEGNKKDELKELLKSATTADLQYEQKYGGYTWVRIHMLIHTLVIVLVIVLFFDRVKRRQL